MQKTDEISSAQHSPNFHLLKRHISYTTQIGYSQTLVNVMINKNSTENYGKYLFVKHYKGFWTLSRRTLKDDFHSDISEGFAELIGDELGFRGFNTEYSNSKFYPIAYLFDVAKQDFDEVRLKSEELKKRLQKGKVYHLIYIEYVGSDILPFENRKDQNSIVNYKWVDYSEGIKLLESNLGLTGLGLSKTTGEFQLSFFKQIHQIYNSFGEYRQG